MKVEFVSETSFQTIEPWYCIYVDGVYKTGSYNKENMDKIYNEIVANPDILNKRKEVLQSAEILVSSENNNKNQ